jgi:predicted amidophosphoribosyltransferase
MNKRSPLHRWADDLLALFYPHLCRLCDRHLPTGAPAVCYRCRLKLPQTYFHQQAENAFTDRFLGRIPLRGGAAFLYFRKGGMAQHIIHQLKYKGKKQLGYDLGKLYGQQLKRGRCFFRH